MATRTPLSAMVATVRYGLGVPLQSSARVGNLASSKGGEDSATRGAGERMLSRTWSARSAKPWPRCSAWPSRKVPDSRCGEWSNSDARDEAANPDVASTWASRRRRWPAQCALPRMPK